MTKVEQFDVREHPEHERPRVVCFSGPEGKLNIHVSREDGSLWMFTDGPRGGDRGHVIVPLHRARQLHDWLDGVGNVQGSMPAMAGALWLDPLRDDGSRVLHLARSVLRRERWSIELDQSAAGEFEACLREWSETALRLTEQQNG